MPDEIVRCDERLILAKLWLDSVRIRRDAFAPRRRLAAALDDMIIGLAIFVGQAEGRPMNLTKIANFVEMPRATAQRKVEYLESKGWVRRRGRTYIIDPKMLNQPSALDGSEKLVKLTRLAGERLTKLGTQPSSPPLRRVSYTPF